MQLGDFAREVARVLDLLAVHLDDDVAGLKVFLGRGSVLGHFGDHGALGFLHADRVGDVVAHILDDDTEPAAIDRAGSLELGDDLLHQSGGHGESNADIAARGREDRGVDADNLAVEVKRGTAGIAAVHRRIDLQIVVRPRADIAVMRRDDAGRHRAAQTERVADREHPVAHARVLGLELDEGERLAVGLDLDERHVRARIGPDQRGWIFVAVLQRDGDVLGVLDHVVVGHDEAVGRDEEARALCKHWAEASASAAACFCGTA